MKRLGTLAIVLAMVLCGTAAWADFYVIGGGGPPVGTKITSLPYEIKNSGFYYLGKNLTTSITSDGAITVKADNVTLDLMGFDLTNNTLGGAGSSKGILMSGRFNVEIRNGTVRGFWMGIYEASSTGKQHRISNVRALANDYGICLTGSEHLVRDSTGSNGYGGIYIGSGMITGSMASNNSNYGMALIGPGSLINNIAYDNTNSGFVFGNDRILVDRNSASSNGLNYSAGGANTAWGVNAGR